MLRNKFLLPGSFKFAGIFFLIAGTILGFIRFYLGIKPDVLDMQPFAFYSSYLANKYLQFIGNNMSEEFVCLFFLAGFLLIAFSRDKEENEMKSELRTQAFYITAYIQFLYLMLAILFTFGMAFIYVIIASIFLPFITFTIAFRILLFRSKKKGPIHESK
jgi:hypothetical protein